ncbi:MAG: DNA alkylation repair protein [Muribaculaceae bacterium]|nr:DNA alkylation repair protein [Muribaculaceae bacterium]
MKEGVTAAEVEACLLEDENDAQRRHLMRFFKTGKGDYGEGDRFIGLTAPQTRLVVKEAKGKVSLQEIEKLLYSPWHESRLAGFLLLVEEMKKSLPKKKDNDKEADIKAYRREEVAMFYLRHARQANNWDLVDMSCPKILGYYLIHARDKIGLLYELAGNENLWLQRISMVTNWMLIREGIFQPTLDIADRLLDHPHDLIHKAVGWMLREVGKRDKDTLTDYLDRNYSRMARTALRYAIEKLPENERLYWLRRTPENGN